MLSKRTDGDGTVLTTFCTSVINARTIQNVVKTVPSPSVHPEPVEAHRIKLVFETGETKHFDVSPYIRGSWFGELNDPSYFKSVRIVDDGYGIEWAHGQDIAPHELYEMSY
jgi:hypothetical protein